MAVYITSVDVRNYRSCKSTALTLSPYTPIVGRNNCGKSNVVAALQWLVRKTKLGEEDFNAADAAVEVIGTLDHITAEDLGVVADKHRKSIEPYIRDGKLSIKRSQATAADTAKLSVLNPDNGEWVPNPTGIDNALSELFPEPIHIGAMEDAAEDASKAKTSTTIGKLLAAMLETIRDRHDADLQVHLGAITSRLSAKGADRFAELHDIDASINTKVKDLFPGVSVRLDFPVPVLEELIKAGTVRVFEDDDADGEGRAFNSFGHGSQRAIQMALVRHLAELRRGQAIHGGVTLLLIDEPELYLHPFAVEHIREALKTLSASGYQVVFTTHSAQMITPTDAPVTVLMTKTHAAGTVARKRLSDALNVVVPRADHQIGLLFELTNACQVFFADRVVLTEGKTELRLLPHIFKHASGRTLGQAGIALVAQTGVNDTKKSMSVLSAMDIPVAAIADLDFAFHGGVTHGYLQANDPDILACKQLLVQLQPQHGFTLDAAGLPTKNGGIQPAKVFELLAAHPGAVAPIQGLAAKLRAQKVWLWTSGAIEAHLGLAGKTETDWAQFQLDCDQRGLAASARDANSITALVEWMVS